MKNWEVKYLDDVCELITCGVAARPNYVDEGVPFLSAKNVKDGQIIWSGYNCITEETHKELTKNNKPLKGDLLYTRVGSYGEAAVIEDDYEFSVFVSLTLIKVDKSKLNNYYLKHYLNSEAVKNLAKASISGSGVGNLNVGTVRKFIIPLPPLLEQQRIVSILDEAFAAIAKAKANAEQNLKNAKELFESYLQGVFENGDWEMKKLKEVAKIFGRGKSKHRPRNWEGLYGGNYPFIQTGEVRNANKYISSYTQTYNEVGLAQSKLWKKGTICITIAANIAETAILDFDACIPDSIIGFEVDEKKADLNFAYYLLQYFKAELQKLGKGSAQDNINLGTFENQYFPFPTVKEQQTIVRQLDALRAETQKLEAVYQKKIADLEELKKSILQKAFAGELRSPEGAAYDSEAATPLAKKTPSSITSPEGA